MLTSMAWLEPAPKDFRDQTRMLQRNLTAASRSEVSAQLVNLANHALDDNQLVTLGGLAKVFFSGGAADPLLPIKLGVFGDGTLSLIAPVIAGSGLRHRLLIDTLEGAYNGALIDATDPAGAIRA